VGVFSREPAPESDSPRSRRIRARAATSTPLAITSVPSSSPGPLSVFSSPQIPPYSIYRPLTAAAVQIRINDKGEVEQFKNRRSSAASAWQSEAWEYYDAIGEIKYAFNLVASVVSRIRLYAAVASDPSDAPVPVDSDARLDPQLASAAQRALARLNSAYGGQPGLLRDAALNLSVSGECYLVQVPERPGQGLPETWDIRSTDELTVDPRGGTMVTPRRDLAGGGMSQGKGGFQLPNKAFVGRIWRPHPRYSDEADSSLRGMLDLCAELLLLNRTFRATARSRLNAGALYLPDGLSVAASPDPDYPYDDDLDLTPGMTVEEAADEFEDQLIDAMTTPIRDEDSASAVVPLIIRGPAELGDKIKQFKFERSFDPALAQRADRVLERILQGLDVPKDVVTGLANVKYSNAVQIDENLYKAHIEPLMLLIVDALTVMYLRPYLLAQGWSPAEVEKIVIWYDPTAVATRNDRAMDADLGFDRHAISYDTWRRAHGFSDADAPTPNELALRMVLEKGQIMPELVEAMLGALAPEIMNAARAAGQAASPAPVPPEVSQLLKGGAPASPATDTTTPSPTDTASPAAPESTGEGADELLPE